MNIKRPKLKSDDNWLCSDDLENALKIYENHLNSKFILFPRRTITMDEDLYTLLSLRIDNEKFLSNYKNKTQFGFIFNMENHWTALFIETNPFNPYAEYFDSYGDPPPKKFKKLYLKLQDTINMVLNSMKNKFQSEIKWTLPLFEDILYHKEKKQKGSEQCGVFVIWFLIHKIIGKSFQDIEDAVVDDDMCILLKEYFWD